MEALDWYQQAGEKGELLGFVRAGLLLASKLNDESPQVQQAQELLLRALEQVGGQELRGEAEALLGWIHLKFLAVRDPFRAVQLLRSSSSNGHAGALFLLACCHLRGAGVPTDEQEAETLLRSALDSWGVSSRKRSFSHTLWCISDIQFTLGQLYLHGCGDVQQDVSKGLTLLGAASEQKHAGATRLLADCFQAGRGCGRDDTKAASLRARATREEREKGTSPMSFLQHL
eukprot:761247-Hanusia_phi.AAC.4